MNKIQIKRAFLIVCKMKERTALNR